MYESRISKELHRQVFELTLALYRVTDFFPHEEALRKHLREKANEVFGGISEYGYTVDAEREAIAILAKIEATRGYLELADGHRFVRPVNITVLMREYEFLADFFIHELDQAKHPQNIKKEKDGEEQKTSEAAEKQTERVSRVKHMPLSAKKYDGEAPKGGEQLNERQKKIVTHLKTVTQAKVSDFSTLFNGISLKTVQRDLQNLVVKNILKKEGYKRWTTYYLNGGVL